MGCLESDVMGKGGSCSGEGVIIISFKQYNVLQSTLLLYSSASLIRIRVRMGPTQYTWLVVRGRLNGVGNSHIYLK